MIEKKVLKINLPKKLYKVPDKIENDDLQRQLKVLESRRQQVKDELANKFKNY